MGRVGYRVGTFSGAPCRALRRTAFAEGSLRLHSPHAHSTTHIMTADISLEGHDEEQIRLMEERCIVLSHDDEYVRDGSKKECHLMTNINTGLLHRAFSCFLFDPVSGKLLLQKRAPEKITFPNMWTNTCCSHPLAIRDELEEKDQIGECVCERGHIAELRRQEADTGSLWQA